MADLHDVMAFLVKGYPHPDDLSNARLTKMIYLADWRAAITKGQQITAIAWPFNHYGPFVGDVIEEAHTSDDFEVVRSQTVYGSPKQVVQLKRPNLDVHLEPWEEEALAHVISTTSELTWAKFIELVYSTYPVVTQDRYNRLDLVQLANDYRELMKTLPAQG